MGKIFSIALESVLLEDISIPSVLNGQDVYIDDLSKEFNKINLLSTAVEDGFVELGKLATVYKTNSSLINIGGLSEERRVAISYESINDANNSLFGETKNYRNTNNLAIAQEDIATTIKYILEKIKEIFARAIAWFKRLWIKLSVWWGDYDKKLKVVTDRIVKVTGDRVMLVQEETLLKLEKLYNLYLNIYKHNSTSVSLSDLIEFSDISKLFAPFTNKKYQSFINDLINSYYEYYTDMSFPIEKLDKLVSVDITIDKLIKNDPDLKSGSLPHNIRKIISTKRDGDNYSYDLEVSTVYGVRNNEIKLYGVVFGDAKYSANGHILAIDEGTINMDYNSGVRITDPSINKEVIENLYKSVSGRKMPLLKDYINNVLKYHNGVKKQISEMVKKVDFSKITENKNNIENAKYEFNMGALKLSNFLGIKLPVEICLTVLENVKLTNKTFKLIYKDLSQRELFFGEIIAQINKAWKIDNATLECLLGMKEFPYVSVPYNVWKEKLSPHLAGICIRLSSGFELNDTVFGTIAKSYFSYYKSLAKHGKYVEPMVLVYNTEVAAKAIETLNTTFNVDLPEHFFYFHELGHSLLDQTYGMQLATLYGAADSKKIKFGAYAMGGENYVLSEVEVEANLFACLMTGYPVEKYIEFERKRCGDEIAARYEKIAKQKMPYIERMVPIKFRLFSSLRS